MVKLTLDTNRDPVEDLEEALEILQEAITRRQAAEQIAKDEQPGQDAAIDTGFFKVTVESESEEEPTLNELLEGDPITEDELQDLFSAEPEEGEEKKEDDGFIEIVEVDDDD